MKNKIVYKYTGKVLITFAILLLCPIIIALYYKEPIIPFIIPAIISLILGIILNKLKPETKYLYAKDGFLIVAISWILISILAALPYVLTNDATFHSFLTKYMYDYELLFGDQVKELYTYYLNRFNPYYFITNIGVCQVYFSLFGKKLGKIVRQNSILCLFTYKMRAFFLEKH